MALQVSRKLETEINELVESGDFADAEDVIGRGVQLLQEVRRRERLIASVVEAGKSLDRGEGRELTPELWQEMLQEASRKARSGEPLDPDVCP
ncbi:MAG: ribbon-helix-helix domain-containing protein [Thermomicrobiales bacterium]